MIKSILNTTRIFPLQTRFLLLPVITFVISASLVGSVLVTQPIWASTTSTWSQTINAGTLTIDIADSTSNYASVGSPAVSMNAVNFSFSCQASTGTFGTATEAIYVSNPDGADNGWTASIAASGTTDVWDSAGTDFDFNDAGGSGCTDGADSDSLGGQLTINPAAGTLDVGSCSSCTTTDITKGSSNAFVEGSTDTITLLTAAGTSDDIGDWDLVGVGLSQQIPGEQPAASDYTIDMVISIAAS